MSEQLLTETDIIIDKFIGLQISGRVTLWPGFLSNQEYSVVYINSNPFSFHCSDNW